MKLTTKEMIESFEEVALNKLFKEVDIEEDKQPIVYAILHHVARCSYKLGRQETIDEMNNLLGRINYGIE